jgi:Asp-tRNA(Asn)/Glu-tRNA(Gln) amidotransferase A subunit family amidase
MKIGYIKDEFDATPATGSPEQMKASEARRAMYAASLDGFRKAGASLVDIKMPDFPAGALRFLLSAEAAAAFDDLTRSKGIDTLTGQGPGDWPNTFRSSRFIPAVEYLRAQRARRLLMGKMDALMSQYDAFLSPAPNSASLTITNLTGHPAIALKAGFIDKLPAAIMVTGRLYDEATICRIAMAFEQATEWHRMNPQLQDA